ncbi:MAG: hypothetical protein ND866_06720 [Pyrinomonadaceae bacterium]|nr:hypothetical protein [Pyrinomonadaceae bacterium]
MFPQLHSIRALWLTLAILFGLPCLTNQIKARTPICRPVLSACMVTTQAQRSGASAARDVVRSISQKEMDQLLFLKPILAPKYEPARRIVLKQINEDFKDLQGLNNKMMAQAWSTPELDYRYISDMVSQIRGKATRLKTNLALPEAKDERKQTEDNFSNAEKFRAALLQLDRHIMSFATNPLFQKPGVIEVDLANRASRDLALVVELSGKLKKSAGKLGKPAKTTH